MRSPHFFSLLPRDDSFFIKLSLIEVVSKLIYFSLPRFRRRTTTSSKGYPSNTCLHFTIFKTTHHDWQWCQRRWAAKYFKLSDDNSRGRKSPWRSPDADFVNVRTSQLDGAGFWRETRHEINFQAAGRREPIDSSTGDETDGIFPLSKHTQVSWLTEFGLGVRSSYY